LGSAAVSFCQVKIFNLQTVIVVQSDAKKNDETIGYLTDYFTFDGDFGSRYPLNNCSHLNVR